MPINELTNFCYVNHNHQIFEQCNNCPSENCLGECNTCLQRIHFHENERGYDCMNMIHCYAASYIYKYSSELIHLLKASGIEKVPEDFEPKVLSLGCGPSPDLFAFNYLLRNNIISYTGIDYNVRWTGIHDQIKNIFPKYKINYNYIDVLDFLDDIINMGDNPYNTIIVQYLINELVHHHQVDDFLRKLTQVVNLSKNIVIVFNDFNDSSTRASILRFVQGLINGHPNSIKKTAYRFNTPIHRYGSAIMHADDKLFFDVPDQIFTKFVVKQPCSSYQLIVRKR